MRKITSLLMLFCAFVGSAWAQLPEITTDMAKPLYYTIYNTRSEQPGGLMYFAGEDVGIKDGCASLSVDDKYKFFFTGSHDALYVHNAAAPGLKLAKIGNGNKESNAGAWTETGAKWQVITRGDGNLAFGKEGATTNANDDNWWNECNYSTGNEYPDFTSWTSSDAGSAFVIEPADSHVFPETDKFYTIECPLFFKTQSVNKGLCVDGNGNLCWNTINLADKNCYWVPTVNGDGTVVLKNLGTGKYLNGTAMSETSANASLYYLGAKNFNIVVNNVTMHANGHGNGFNASGSIVNYGGVIGSASAWTFVEQQDPDAQTVVTVKYSFVYDGKERYDQVTECIANADYPNITVSHPYGVSCAAKPAGTINASEAVGGVITKEIALTISGLPFQYSDTYANATWYFMNLKPQDSGKWYLGYEANQEYIPLGDGQKALPATGQDAFLWAFVGNPFDGYKIMNKAAGENMILSSSTNTQDGNTGANTYPVLTSLTALDGKNTYWIPTSASSYATNGFYLAQKDNSSNKMNARSGKLAYWNGGADVGSTFQVTTLADFANYDIATLLSDAGKVGYPKTSSAAYTELNRVNTLGEGRATVLDVEHAVSTYKKATDIQLPVDGKAYTIANYSRYNEGTTRYLNYTAGSALSVSEDVNNASVFVCKQLSNGVYAFVTSDGKVLTWMYPNHGYQEGGKYNGYSSEYGTTCDSKSDWNKITVKKNGTAEVDYGFLRMVARRTSSSISSFIIKGTEGTWDRASDSYYFDDNNSYYSSAWIFTEVAHENSEAENLAVAKIGAKLPLETKTLGEGLGKYHYLVNGVENYTADALNGATTAEEVNTIAATLTINQPKTGFYRIKSANANAAEKKGKYWQLNAESAMELGALNKLNSIVYYNEGKILLYGNGLYLNNYETQAAVGTEPTTWTILENATVAGTYALRYEVNGGNNGFLSDWSGLTNGLNDGNATWEFEEVTWLPIPVNEEAGYTSLYSPVELALSSNRFKAYTVSNVNAGYATLEEQTVVPAGVGVVLELQEGAQVEDGCVFLQVKATETTNVTSTLLGTYADEFITTDSYVLGYVGEEGNKEVGFYTATKNFNEAGEKVAEGGVKWLNNGFKAYLPKTAAAKVLRFNFGGNTTAIESVVNGLDVNAPIYDLSGRRVVNTVKGGLYIQNGKKFIVK